MWGDYQIVFMFRFHNFLKIKLLIYLDIAMLMARQYNLCCSSVFISLIDECIIFQLQCGVISVMLHRLCTWTVGETCLCTRRVSEKLTFTWHLYRKIYVNFWIEMPCKLCCFSDIYASPFIPFVNKYFEGKHSFIICIFIF